MDVKEDVLAAVNKSVSALREINERRKLGAARMSDATLEAVRNDLRNKLVEGAVCPCCDQKVKAKTVELTPRHGAIVLLLYKTFPVGTAVSVDMLLKAMSLNGWEKADVLLKGKPWKELAFWRVLHQVELTKEVKKFFMDAYPDAKGKPDLYQLTQSGLEMLQGNSVYRCCHVYEGEVVGVDAEKFTNLQHLVSEAYDWDTLCGVEVPTVGVLGGLPLPG